MKHYTERIEEMGLEPDDQLQEMMDGYDTLYENYEKAKDNLKQAQEEGEDVDDLKEIIASVTAELHEQYNEIQEYITDNADDMKKAKETAKNTKAAPEQKEATNPASAAAQAQPKAPAKETSGGGFGWALFGVLALVVTFGAVNTFNK